MNFVAGFLLLFMNEEDAFWCLCTIVEDLLPGYFSHAMVAPQVSSCLTFRPCFVASKSWGRTPLPVCGMASDWVFYRAFIAMCRTTVLCSLASVDMPVAL